MESVDDEIVHLSSSHGISLKGLSATTETSVSLSAFRPGIDLRTPYKLASRVAACFNLLFGFHMRSLICCFRL